MLGIGHSFIPLLRPGNIQPIPEKPDVIQEIDHPAGKSLPAGTGSPVCVFIGEGSLLQQCIQAVLAEGFVVLAVVSADSRINALSRQQGILQAANFLELEKILDSAEVDFLFSVVNHRIISPSVLRRLKGMAIKFHDGPLPRYAGLHATSWAILNGEQKHGITWHVADEEIDTGAILLQKEVSVDNDDTALTLNAKCYQAAAEGFKTLLHQLKTGQLTSVPQPAQGRSYFSRQHRPAQGGVISFRQPAGDIWRLCRALDFGPYPNPLGLPKVWDGQQFFLPAGFRVLDIPSVQSPGTVTLKDHEILVATGTTDVSLAGVSTLEGKLITPLELRKDYGWTSGTVLGKLPPVLAARIERRDADFARHQAYWAEKLQNMQPASLPFASRIRQAAQPVPYHCLWQNLPEDIESDPAFAWDGAAFLAAALAVYLYRISGQSEVWFGFSSRRLCLMLDEVPPYFAGWLPARAVIGPETSLNQICSLLHKELSTIGKKRTYSRDLVARYPSLRGRQELQDGPVFPVSLFVQESSGAIPDDLPGPLTLVIQEKGTRYAWIGDSARLGKEAMEQIAGQFHTLLNSMINQPATAAGKLTLLPAAERDRILYGWNQTAFPYNEAICLHQLFEHQTAKTPDAAALFFGSHCLSYAQVNRRANQLAHHLQNLGVGPNVPVGVGLEKSLEKVISVLGILKAGGAYVPLDPLAPRDRLALMLEDLQLPVILTQPHLQDRFAAFSGQVIPLKNGWEGFAGVPDENPRSEVNPDHLAYIIFTSGSTGVPKGVAVKHRPVINLIEWVNRTFRIGPGDRVLFINSLGFDLSVYDIFGLLSAGGSIRIASREELQDPQKLLHILYHEPITFWNSAPAALSQLIPFSYSFSPARKKTRLRLAFLSGDWIPLSMPGWIRSVFPGTQVISLGGATEATVWSNYFPVGTVEEHWASIPYGKPIQNARYHILNDFLEPVPVGVTGNLYIGGSCLAEGYFQRPELTAGRFIPDPFGQTSSDRLYKTGDLARYWPDGTIEFLGRADFQVKIRGYRVELGEIEAVLSQRRGIREVLVMAVPDPAGGKCLIAYLVPESGGSVDAHQLRQYLQEKLPEYMIPSAFVWLDAFPVNASGKIDRKALPAPERLPEPGGDYLPPRTSTEILLGKIWQQVLQREKIGVQTNFFQTGGHSLAAGQVISHLHQITGRLLPLSAIFAHPSIEKLGAFLDQSTCREAWKSVVMVKEGGARPPLVCIHPISGDIEYAYKLASWLPDDQPVYGILAWGINGVDEPFPTIEQAAAAYTRQLMAHFQPGPVYLAGYSYGGYVAWEMARQLQSHGYQVENLILFDTYLINQARTYRNYPARYVLLSCLSLLFSVQNLRDFFRNQYWRGLVRRGKAVLKVAGHRVGMFPYPKPLPKDPDELSRPVHSVLSLRDQIRERLYRVLGEAAGAYTFDTYSGDVVFIRAVEGAARYLKNSDFGWNKKIKGNLVVYDVQGVDHYNLFREDEDVRTIAALVEKNLNKTGETKPPPDLST